MVGVAIGVAEDFSIVAMAILWLHPCLVYEQFHKFP